MAISSPRTSIDECGVTTDLLRRYGRSPRGVRLYDHTPCGHWETRTVIAALRLEGLGAPAVSERCPTKARPLPVPRSTPERDAKRDRTFLLATVTAINSELRRPARLGRPHLETDAGGTLTIGVTSRSRLRPPCR
jgi:hypothetical protein